MGRVFLALVALVGLMWFFAWYGKATPKQRNNAVRNLLVYGIAGGLILLVVIGKAPVLFAALGAALPWIHRGLMAKRLWGMFKSAQGPSTGQTSRIDTQFLAMQLEHESGRLDGEILAGRFAGQMLSALELNQLVLLLQDYQTQDVQSASVLVAFLDRHFADWRDQFSEAHSNQSQGSQTTGPDLTPTQAYQILGLEQGISAKDVIGAHKRLMQKLHPDRGGSDFLASQVNRAKDILLDEIKS